MPRLTVNLSFHIDGMSAWIATMKSNSPSALSRGEFTLVATPRVLALLKRKGLTATFAVPGHTAYAFPTLMKQIRDDGHEIAHHGWIHENPADFSERDERRNLYRGIDAIHATTGKAPVGYVSPAGDLSPNTLLQLKECGFIYDASCFGDDYNAYYPRVGDSWSMDQPYVFGRPIDLVELPWSWHLDDLPAFEFIIGLNTGLKSHDHVEETWRREFEFAYNNCPDGIITIVMHPEVIARGSRISVLERFIDFVMGHEEVKFDTLESYACSWRDGNPLEKWSEANRLRLGLDAIQEFPAATYSSSLPMPL